VLIFSIAPLLSPERSFMLVQLLLSFSATFALHLEQWEEIWVYSPTKAVCTQILPLNMVCTHLHTQLQLSLGIWTRWLRGLNQRTAALHSSFDLCVLLPPQLS
jgi:hypothetical protein